MHDVPEKIDLHLPQFMQAVDNLTSVGAQAWQTGFMAGFSGNLSMRLSEDKILLTASGTRKGCLKIDDFVLVKLNGEKILGRMEPSTESRLHLEIYAAYQQCGAIVHTHPAKLQALEIINDKEGTGFIESFKQMGLYEAQIWAGRLAVAACGQPGTAELASSAVDAVAPVIDSGLPCAVWLPGHGLCALGAAAEAALAITEELEHLAGIQLIAG